MKRFLTLFLLVSVLAMVAPACSKYTNGPKFTLLTKKSRLANEWILTSYMINGNEFIESQPQIKLALDKDETYSWSSTQTVLGQLQSQFDNGTWSLSDDKVSLLMLPKGEEIAISYTITDLRANKMVLSYYNKVTNITYVSTYETAK
jgi:hypothetical protein